MMAINAGRGSDCYISESFADVFAPFIGASFDELAAFPGEILKSEAHVVIRHFKCAVPSHRDAEDGFILKQYRYSQASRLRRWASLAKSQREFHTLVYCRELGIPTVQPVGFGVQRSVLKSVASCFLITKYARGFVSLRDWLRAGGNANSKVDDLVGELGYSLRRAHARNFFFFRLLAKNILVCENGDSRLDWRLLDQGYSRHLKTPVLARAGQLRDIGSILGSVCKYGKRDISEAFYRAYLPDPLGADEYHLRRRAALGARIYDKRTVLQRLTRVGKRASGSSGPDDSDTP